jgi:predicted nuclease with TOPRIM domain
MMGIAGRTREMKKILFASQQKYLYLETEYSKKRKVYDAASELFDGGMQQSEIFQVNEILRAYKTKLPHIKQDLLQYGNLTNATNQVKIRMDKLRAEFSDLSLTVDKLRAEKNKISQDIKSLNNRYYAIELDFEKRMKERAVEVQYEINKLNNEYCCANKHALERLGVLKGEEKKEISLLQKIHVPQEFSPIIEAARGHEVDGEDLRKDVARSMELMIHSLDEEYNGQAKSDMSHALDSLKSEFIVF